MNFSIARYVIVALSLFLVTPAQSAPSDCQVLLEQFQKVLGEIGNADTYKEARLQNVPTVKIISDAAGRFGGKLLTLEKIGHRWGSKVSETKFDPQGDPRWFIETLGPKGAKVFGFYAHT